MDNVIPEIKSRLDVVDVISDYIQLQKAGANYKVPCPFHDEKTPSFVVSPEKQIWHCFGCGLGGDIFTFVEKIENVDFSESLRILAKKAGVKLSKGNPHTLHEKNRMMQILDAANKFFIHQLFNNSNAKNAQEYIKKRGLEKKIIEDFEIGYAPNSWDSLLKFLVSRKFNLNDIESTGLIIKKEKSSGYYDRFRNRLIFPIKNHNNEVIGFGGRVLEKDQKGGKYINSPQSIVYNKSLVIYGLSDAKKYIKENDYAIVVEGYMDVIANHKANIKNVIASSGTAFTQEQTKLLKRYTNNLYFCFDMDLAGQNALARGINLALQEGMNLKVIRIPDKYGKDPDECISKDINIWKTEIKNAKNIVEYYFDQFLTPKILEDIDKKTKVVNSLINLISKIQDKVKQVHWVEKLSERTNIDIKILQEKLNEKNNKERDTKKQPQKKETSKPTESTEVLIYKKLFALIIGYPKGFKKFIAEIDEHMINSDILQGLYKNLIIFYNENNKVLPITLKGGFDYNLYIKWLINNNKPVSQKINQNSIETAFNRLFLLTQEEYKEYTDKQYNQEIEFTIKRTKEIYSKKRIKEISKILDTETDLTKLKVLNKEFNELLTYFK